ncbi:hypothetical protein FHU14_000570 [Mesorhizobium sp. RMAD-H1]|nr:hypothetical protein [Mesorhizobium sp. RMAD-H1]
MDSSDKHWNDGMEMRCLNEDCPAAETSNIIGNI